MAKIDLDEYGAAEVAPRFVYPEEDYKALEAELAGVRSDLAMCEAKGSSLEMRERVKALEAALRNLRNETVGILGAFEPEVRAAVGNTNWSCLFRRIDQTGALLVELAK